MDLADFSCLRFFKGITKNTTINRDTVNIFPVSKASVAKNSGKTLIFLKKFWNHGTEECSLGVIMKMFKAEPYLPTEEHLLLLLFLLILKGTQRRQYNFPKFILLGPSITEF